MTQTVVTSADGDRAAEIRNALTDKLRSNSMITSPVVERAFRTVPRHLFVPEGTPLEVAYDADDSVATKRERDGVVVSSISAPFIQAQMIEQAGLGPGMSVLEIGSGGYNAALVRHEAPLFPCGDERSPPLACRSRLMKLGAV